MRRAPLWIAIAGGVIAGGIALDAIGLPSSYLFAALLLGLAIALARPGSVGLDPLASAPPRPWPASRWALYLQTEALRAVAGSLVPVLLVSAGDARAQPRRGRDPRPHDAAGPAHRRARDDRRRGVRDRGDVRRAGRRRPAGGVHAVPAGARRGAADADRDRRVLRRRSTGAAARRRPPPACSARRGSGRSRPSWRSRARGRPAGCASPPAAARADDPDRRGRARRPGGRLRGARPARADRVRADRPAGRVALHAGDGPAARAPDRARPARHRRAAGRELRARRPARLTTSATLLDAYLATTPGGLYAVLAVAFGAGADTTFIVAVQSLRVVAMVLLAPLGVRWLLQRGG